MDTKTCTKCKRELALTIDNFGQYTQKKNGKTYFNSRCKECAKTISNNYYYDNNDAIKEKVKNYYLRTKDVTLNISIIEKYNQIYLLKNKTRICNTCMIEKNIINFEQGFNKGKIYHRKKCKECDKSRVNLKNNNRKKIRLTTDPNYKLYHLISNKIRAALDGNKAGKSFKKYLNYTLDELKLHLESQFESWMNWSNWGIYECELWKDDDISTWRWQIDHIIPHSGFKYSSMSDKEFKDCWALNNLRPYSAKQNIIDGDRWI